MNRIAVVIVAAALAMPAAAEEDAPISNGATLDNYLAARRAAEGDRAEWVNPYVSSAPEEAAIAAAAGISGDVSLDRAMAEHLRSFADGITWRNPHLPASMVEGNEASGSGDEVLARAVAPYTRERLDAGGWQNRLMRDEHYACGNPMLRVAPGEGVTTSEVRIVLAAAR